jgi:hypothetical protein
MVLSKGKVVTSSWGYFPVCGPSKKAAVFGLPICSGLERAVSSHISCSLFLLAQNRFCLPPALQQIWVNTSHANFLYNLTSSIVTLTLQMEAACSSETVTTYKTLAVSQPTRSQSEHLCYMFFEHLNFHAFSKNVNWRGSKSFFFQAESRE